LLNVDPDAGLEGCRWEWCGQTDRGVSAVGTGGELVHATYARSNGILPPLNQVYAQSPILPSLCVSHAECDTNIFLHAEPRCRCNVHGAVQLIGEHNFCNLYELDPAKQLTSFQQHILCVDISPLGSGNMHVFDLVGTVFLYNQMRHIMAVLLLTGAQFKLPSVISTLLNIRWWMCYKVRTACGLRIKHRGGHHTTWARACLASVGPRLPPACFAQLASAVLSYLSPDLSSCPPTLVLSSSPFVRQDLTMSHFATCALKPSDRPSLVGRCHKCMPPSKPASQHCACCSQFAEGKSHR
jgi:hypothetical protein